MDGEMHDWVLINEALEMYKQNQASLLGQSQSLEDEAAGYSILHEITQEQLKVQAEVGA